MILYNSENPRMTCGRHIDETVNEPIAETQGGWALGGSSA
jgi:hypothetical protein